jgi:hypothetical protein
MKDQRLQFFKELYRGKKTPMNWLTLEHFMQDVVACEGGYSEYAWYYHNKITVVDAIKDVEKIIANDKDVFFVYYIGYPLANTLGIANYLKMQHRDRCSIVYYKSKFWDTEMNIPEGQERNFHTVPFDANHDFDEAKETEDGIIKIADRLYLADSLNTHGEEKLDGTAKVSEIVAYRNTFLANNRQFILKSMKNAVYEIYNSIKGE